MKVTVNNGVNVIKMYSDNRIKTAGNRGNAAQKYDSIEISKEGFEVSKYAAIAKEVPDVRAQKVSDIKTRIHNGAYVVSSYELAGRILNTIKEEKVQPWI